MSTLVVEVVLDGGGEEGIDECCLAETRLSGNLDVKTDESIKAVCWIVYMIL